MREILHYLKVENIEISQFPMPPGNLAELILLVEKNKITLKMAKEKLFPRMIRSKKRAVEIIKEDELSQFSDVQKIKELVLKAVKNNPRSVQQYKKGKVRVLGYLVGQVMRETKGTANPQLVNQILKETLDEEEVA